MSSPDNTRPVVGSPEWIVSTQASSAGEPSIAVENNGLVMAWARDIRTRELRYIGELSPAQKGKESGCECLSCGLPLVAVNAGKRFFRRRPHFRHPEGADKDSCEVLSARAIVLETFRRAGILRLPSRGTGHRITGLSGQLYEAWVEAPSEEVRLRSFDFVDKTSAILTLEDGRQLRVVLTGGVRVEDAGQSGEFSLIPTLRLLVDDPEISALAPEELRKRLQLLVAEGTWCSHWQDAELEQQAHAAALNQALDRLDWLPEEIELPEELSPLLKRETLLHLLAKEILGRARRVTVPDLHQGSPRPGHSIAGRVLELSDVELERSMGCIRPDVVASTIAAPDWPAGKLLVEITVTHGISAERLKRIAAAGLPAIEIDLSILGGVVTSAQFEKILLEEVAAKRWLYHPRIGADRPLVETGTASLLEVPLHTWATGFLDAVRAFEQSGALSAAPELEPPQASDALIRCAEGLKAHGHHIVTTGSRLNWEFVHLVRAVLAIQDACPAAPGAASIGDQIDDLLTDEKSKRPWQSLYLMAIRAYKPVLTAEQQALVERRRAEVWASLQRHELRYFRPLKFDQVFACLFPALAEMLSQPLLPNASPVPRVTLSRQSSATQGSAARSQADLWTSDRPYAERYESPGGDWLTGEALERWKRRFPDSVKNWDWLQKERGQSES